MIDGCGTAGEAPCGLVCEALAAQPPSPAKVACVFQLLRRPAHWRGAVDRRLVGGRHRRLAAKSELWRREVERARPMLHARLADALGAEVVKRVVSISAICDLRFAICDLLGRGLRRTSRWTMRETVIVSAVRTPTGKFLGVLKDFKATDLGALVVAEAVRRAGIDPASVDECIMGNVVSAGLGQEPARQAALRGGLSNGVARAHDQQGVRLRPEGRDARRTRRSRAATSTSPSRAAWSR